MLQKHGDTCKSNVLFRYVSIIQESTSPLTFNELTQLMYLYIGDPAFVDLFLAEIQMISSHLRTEGISGQQP